MDYTNNMMRDVFQQRKENAAYYFDFLKGIVGVVAQRNQFLLVFQSMLFGALGVLIGKDAFFPLWVIILLGLTVSVVWLYVNAVSYTNEEAVEKELNRLDPRFRAIVAARKKFRILSYGNSSKIVTFFFPSVTMVTWTLLLGFYRRASPQESL